MKVKTQQLIDRSLGKILIGINLFAARILGMVLKRNHSIQHPPNTILKSGPILHRKVNCRSLFDQALIQQKVLCVECFEE